LPESIYQAGIDAFGKQGMAEIIYLVGCFHLLGVILNGYDVSVLGREDGEPTLEADVGESDSSRDKTFSR
jgi:hypothetical protein